MNSPSVSNRQLPSLMFEVAAGLFSSPVVSAVLAIALAVVAMTLLRRRAGDSSVLRGESIAIGVVAGAVVLGWIVDVVLRGYVFNMSMTVSWWRFAVAPMTAAVGLLIFMLTRGRAHQRRPADAGSVSRRTWTTFGPRNGVVTLAVLTVGAIFVAVVFGRMSFEFDSGMAAHIALRVPNTDDPPVVVAFPGWAYGVPLIVAALFLVASTVIVLHRNARRPFSAQLALGSERAHRSAVARDVTTIAIGAVLIALAGFLRMARGGVVSSMVTMSDSGSGSSVTVAIPHADVIMVGGFLAPLLEIGGCALLALLALRALGHCLAPVRRSPAVAGVVT